MLHLGLKHAVINFFLLTARPLKGPVQSDLLVLGPPILVFILRIFVSDLLDLEGGYHFSLLDNLVEEVNGGSSVAFNWIFEESISFGLLAELR